MHAPAEKRWLYLELQIVALDLQHQLERHLIRAARESAESSKYRSSPNRPQAPKRMGARRSGGCAPVQCSEP